MNVDCDLFKKETLPKEDKVLACAALVSYLKQFLKPRVERVVDHRVQSTVDGFDF